MSLDMIDEPWFESPFFYEILKSKKSNSFKKHAISMHENGYCVLDLKLSDNFINNIIKDIDKSLNTGEFKTNPKIYHYNKYPRIVEALKFSKNVAKLANNTTIKKFLKFMYKSKPLTFYKINFIGGSEQPFHSDYIHFGSMPHKYLVGAWVALEDTHKNNGPLTVVPGSHKLPLIDYQDLKRKQATNIKELEKNYRVYEDYVRNMIKYKKLKIKELHIKKGQVIIWAANILHGGVKMKNHKLTRKSQVIHFHFSDNKFNYNPGFSDPKRGHYVERKLDIVKVQ